MEPSRSPESLLPGLPNDLTLDFVLPRLPWYTRYVLTSVSKLWHSFLQQPSLFSPPIRQLLQREGLIVVHRVEPENPSSCSRGIYTANSAQAEPPASVGVELELADELPFSHYFREFALSLYFPHCHIWQALPPISDHIPYHILENCRFVCVDSRLFVLGGCHPEAGYRSPEVHMLNLAAGLWRWEKRSSMTYGRHSFPCVSVRGRIYAFQSPKEYVGWNILKSAITYEMYDVKEDQWCLLPYFPHLEWEACRRFRCRENCSGLIKGVTASGSRIFAYGMSMHKNWIDEYNYSGFRLHPMTAIYDVESGNWKPLEEFEVTGRCTAMGGNLYDLRDGTLFRYECSSGACAAIRGRIPMEVGRKGNVWRTDELLGMKGDGETWRVYAMVHREGEDKVRLWRGDVVVVDDEKAATAEGCVTGRRVVWEEMRLPSQFHDSLSFSQLLAIFN